MIDPAGDLSALLSDAGGVLRSSVGDFVGRFVDEPVLIELESGQTINASEPVVYTSAEEIDRIGLIKGASVEVGSRRYEIRNVPSPETSGLVRLELVN